MVTESDILTLQGRVSNTGNINIFNGCYSSTAADSPTTRTVVSYGTIDAAFATYYVDYLIELSQAFNEDITIVFKLSEAGGAEVEYSGTLAAGEDSILLSELDVDYSLSTLESREDTDDTIEASITGMPVGTVNFNVTVLTNTTADFGTDDIEVAWLTTKFAQGIFKDESVITAYSSTLDANSILAACISKLACGDDNVLIDVAGMDSEDIDAVLSGYQSNRQRVIDATGIDTSSAQKTVLEGLLGGGEGDDSALTEFTITDRVSEASAAIQAWSDIIGRDIPLTLAQISGVLATISPDDITAGDSLAKEILAEYYNMNDAETRLLLSRIFDMGWYFKNVNPVTKSGSSFATVDGEYVSEMEARGGAINNYLSYLTENNAAISVTTTTLADAQNSVAYSESIAASGGIGDYTYTATGLPTGLEVSGATIAGTPNDTAGDFDVYIEVVDFIGNSATTMIVLTLTD